MYTKGTTLDGARNTLKNIHESLCCSIEKMKQTTGKKFRSSSKNRTPISKEKIMGIIIQLVLFALNLTIGIMNYNLENYGLAMFNTTVAGLCLGFFISMIVENVI